MLETLTNNWEWVLIAFMVLEKVIKMSPTKSDDILLDMIIKSLMDKVKPK